jgi:hypothetical protein
MVGMAAQVCVSCRRAQFLPEGRLSLSERAAGALPEPMCPALRVCLQTIVCYVTSASIRVVCRCCPAAVDRVVDNAGEDVRSVVAA